MKKNIKKILAALLCVGVLFGCAVTAFADVYDPVQSYSVTNVPELHPGEQFQMVVQVYPEDAPCMIRYEVDDETVATIDENGLITAHEVGSTGFWVYIEYETGAYGCANNVVVIPLEESDDSNSDTNEQTIPDAENGTVPDAENNADEGKDAFRCNLCDWYESNKEHPIAIVRCVFWMIHTITHLVQQIKSLT